MADVPTSLTDLVARGFMPDIYVAFVAYGVLAGTRLVGNNKGEPGDRLHL